MSSIAKVDLSFWIMKISATTLGETGGDLLSMTLNVGYAMSSFLLVGLFLITLVIQLKLKKYNPLIFWTVILTTSTAGTTMSDFMDRTLKLGYAKGSLLLISCLLLVLLIWRLSEKTISVNDIKTKKAELFFWIAILFSNTLGTALGDFLSTNAGLGFMDGTILVESIIFLTIIAWRFTKISRTTLFWIAFVLTRPFGATFGDFLTKSTVKGGLNFGTIGSSIFLASLLGILIIFSIIKDKKQSAKD